MTVRVRPRAPLVKQSRKRPTENPLIKGFFVFPTFFIFSKQGFEFLNPCLRGLKGEESSLRAKIIVVADAMTSNRTYGKALS